MFVTFLVSLNLTVRGVSNKHCLLTFFISVYFQKYEIFVYESAKQAMDETFFPTWD